jgi:hypothetical protein
MPNLINTTIIKFVLACINISLATNVTSHCDVDIAISTAPIPPVVNDTVPINSIVL